MSLSNRRRLASSVLFKKGKSRRKQLNRRLIQETLERRQLLAADVAGDDLASAQVATLQANQTVELDGSIGDGNHGGKDVDLFRVDLTTGQSINIDVDASYTDDGSWLSSLDSYLRVFDQTGNELASNSAAMAQGDNEYSYYARDSFLTFQAPNSGVFYIGVSGESSYYDYYGGAGNHAYDPSVAGSGIASTTGAYKLQLLADAPSGPSITVSDAQAFESDGSLSFEISLSEAVSGTVTANFATAGLTASAGSDYVETSGSIVFAPGETVQTISVAVLEDDLVDESNYETLAITLSDVTGINVADSYAEGKIANDDFTIGDTEGDILAHAWPASLQANQVVEFDGEIGDGNFSDLDVDLFRIDLTAGQTVQIDVDASYTDSGSWLSSLDSYLRVFDDSGNELASNSSAVASGDYEYAYYARDSFLSFQAPNSGVYYIGVSGESSSYESYGESSNHAYDPKLPGSGVASSTGAYKLQLLADTPSGPSLSVEDAEGFESDGHLFFSIQLSEPVAFEVLADFTTSDQSAINGQDYQEVMGTVSFAAGETVKTIAVPVVDDEVVNENSLESLLLTVTTESGITIADGVGEGFIVNNDFLQGDTEGDLLGHAMPVSLVAAQALQIDATIGDGNFANLDVDLFKVQLSAGQSIEIDVDANYTDGGSWLSSLDSHLRVFDSNGTELANNSSAVASNDYQYAYYARDSSLSFVAPADGSFYIGISGESSYYDSYGSGSNQSYDPRVPGSGVASSSGAYQLQLVSDADVVTDGDAPDPSADTPAVLTRNEFSIEEASGDQRTVTFSGEFAGAATSIEIDVNLDGSADYSVALDSTSTFSVSFEEPAQGLPEVSYAFVQPSSGLSSWQTLQTLLPEPPTDDPSDDIVLALERIIGDPDDAMSAVESLVGTVDGASVFDSVTLEVDYEGDEFADTYFDITGLTTIDVNVIEGAMTDSAVVRLALLDYATGAESHSSWESVVIVDLRDDGGDDGDDSGDGGSDDGGDDGDDSGSGTDDSGTDGSDSQPNSAFLDAILAAVPDSVSPRIALAATINSDGTGKSIVAGSIADPSFGSELTVYRKVGDSLTQLGETTLSDDGNTVFRMVAEGVLSAGDQVIVHQHDDSASVGSVSAIYDVAAFIDSDSDGISEVIESSAPGGDGNLDGIPDAQQADVATLIEAATGTTTTFDGGGATLVGVGNTVPSDQTVAAFVPQGLYSFEIHGVSVSGVHAINVHLDADSDFGVWMKQDPATGEMNEFLFDGETGAIKTDFGFTIYFKDGGRGDDDGIANGIIVDPSGPGYGIGGELNIGYWPSAPQLYDVEIDVLPGVPAGLDDDYESGGSSYSVPDSIQSSMDAAYTTYQSEIATHRSTYNTDVATAEADYESSRATASTTYNSSVASATDAYSSASEDFAPAGLQTLQDALTAAEQEYQTAYDAAMQAISERGETESMAIMDAQYTRDGNAEQAFQDASEAIYEAAHDGAEDYDDIDWDAVSADISAAQQTRDDAIIESAKTAALASASLAKSLANETADAAKAEYEAVQDAANALQKASIDNDYDYKDEIIEAYAGMQRDMAAASAAYSKDIADAKKTRDTALANALKAKLKNDNAASTTYSKEMATLQYDAVVANESGTSSRLSTFREAMALAARDMQHEQLDAEKARRDSYIDADATLEGEIASATAQQTKDQADATQTYMEELADAKETFGIDFYGQKRDDSKESADDQNTATKAFVDLGRNYAKAIAGVNQVRSQRNAEELEGIRKDQALNSNQYQHGLIDQATYQARAATLASDAADTLRDIAKETFGPPPPDSTTGALPALGPDDDPTESRASIERFIAGSSATRKRSDASAGRSAGFASSLKGWTHSYESSVKAANARRADANETARETAEADMAAALRTWTGTIASAEADYTSDTASAYSNYNVAVAAAVVAYEKGLAQDRNDAIDAYSTANPDNIWAKYQAAKAAADSARTNSVGGAYNTYIGATAPAEAAVASDVATRQAAYLNAEIDAAVTYEGAIVDSTNTYQSSIRSAEATNDGARQGAISSYDGSVASANSDLHDTATEANLKRDGDNLHAFLTSLYERIYLPSANVLQNKRDAEADAGAAFASTMIGANQAHRDEVADANEQRAKDLASASNSFVTASGNANKDHQKRVADAAKAYQDTIADEAKSSQKDVADYNHTYQTAMVNADEAYTKSVADANLTHAKAMADASAQFEKDFAASRVDAARDWAGDGVSDPITRYEQYVIDVYAAQETWTNETADASKANKHAIADANKHFVHDVASASATQQREYADAAKAITSDGADVNNTFEKNVIAARTTETKSRADAVALRIDETATGNSSFGSNLAGKIRAYRGSTLGASETAASSTADAEEAYHRDSDHIARNASMADVAKWMEIDMASADASKAAGIAGIIDSWGSDLAAAFQTQATDESTAVKTRVTDITSAWKTAVDDSDADSERYSSDRRSANQTYNNDVQTAVETFVSATGTAYVTATEAMGDADQTLAKALAEAEAGFHVGSQSDLVADMLSSYGPSYNPYEAWEIRVARGQLAYLNDFQDDYIAYAEAAAENAADYADDMATASTTYDNDIETAVTTYVSSTGGAYTGSADLAGTDTLTFYSASTTGAVTHADKNALANDTYVVDMSGTTADNATDRLKAETAHYKEQAKQGHIRAQERHGEVPLTPSSDDYLEDYN
ncbi:Calx-beta domain-containing protein, partial [Rhodopirellula bahusiensis]